MKTSLVKFYRNIFYRGGYGVHSPFVFDLITNVIEERRLYYCYERIYPVRLQILQSGRKVTFHRHIIPIAKALRKYCFTEQENRLLFRLANRFQSKTIYVAGSDFGLTPLYLTAYSAASACIVVEPEPTVATIAREYLNKYTTATFVMQNNFTYIPDNLDFIVFGYSFKSFSIHTFEHFLPHINDNTVMIIAGINASTINRKTWKSICAHPKVTVTIDLYRLGIVFFNPKLYQQTYNCIVMG